MSKFVKKLGWCAFGLLAVVLFFTGMSLIPAATPAADELNNNEVISDTLDSTADENQALSEENTYERVIDEKVSENSSAEVPESPPEQDSTDSTSTLPTNEDIPLEQTETTIPENSTFSIRFIDVGQADAALVECDGHYMLIDGGNKEDSSKIYSILKATEVPKLDLVVGTHAHEDHIGGVPGAYNYCSADLTLCPVTSYDSEAFEDFVKYANENGGGITVPKVGDTYALGSSTITILGVNSSEDTNDSSIVLKIQYGKTSFLLTGDAERAAEQVILSSGVDLSATVLKVGHHGSDTSTTYPFLREIMPMYAVISVGEGNSYGHPTENTLSRLRDADVTVFRTDLQGDIICTSDGDTVTFEVEKNEGADTLAPAVVTVPEEVPESEVVPEPETTTPPVTEEPEPLPEPEPAGTDYILNTNTGKFHYPWCSSVDQMKESNKDYYTGTRDEVISMGYDPCGRCHP